MSRVLHKLGTGVGKVKEAVKASLTPSKDKEKQQQQPLELDENAQQYENKQHKETQVISRKSAELAAEVGEAILLKDLTETKLHRPTPMPSSKATESDMSANPSLGTLTEEAELEDELEGEATGSTASLQQQQQQQQQAGSTAVPSSGDASHDLVAAAERLSLHRPTPMPTSTTSSPAAVPIAGATAGLVAGAKKKRGHAARRRGPVLGALSEDGEGAAQHALGSDVDDEADLGDEAADEVGELRGAGGPSSSVVGSLGSVASLGTTSSLHRPTPFPMTGPGSEAGRSVHSAYSVRSSSPGGSFSSLMSLEEIDEEGAGPRSLRRLSSGSGSVRIADEHFPDDLQPPEVQHGPRHTHSLSAIQEDERVSEEQNGTA